MNAEGAILNYRSCGNHLKFVYFYSYPKGLLDLLDSFLLFYRPVAMGCHGVANATPGQQDASFLPPLGNCSCEGEMS